MSRPGTPAESTQPALSLAHIAEPLGSNVQAQDYVTSVSVEPTPQIAAPVSALSASPCARNSMESESLDVSAQNPDNSSTIRRARFDSPNKSSNEERVSSRAVSSSDSESSGKDVSTDNGPSLPASTTITSDPADTHRIQANNLPKSTQNNSNDELPRNLTASPKPDLTERGEDYTNPVDDPYPVPKTEGLKPPQLQGDAAHANKRYQYQPTRQSSVATEAPRRLLGILPEYQAPYDGSRNYDYTQKYPPDELGKEANENARAWRVYLDEAEDFDHEMLRGFRDTLDALLVFAALFSAVVTTFVVSTSESFQPDYTLATARLMVEQNQLLRAAGNITALDSVPRTFVDLDSADVSTSVLWINGLFFASLSLSLATALLSVLVKQWLQAYSSSLPSGNARDRAKIRQFRYLGLVQWKVPEIIGILPLILHASLALFMVGLSLYVSDLHRSLCWVVVSVTAISFGMYLGSVFIPVFTIQCPYRIPILFAPLNFIIFPFRIVKYYWQRVYCDLQHFSIRIRILESEWPSLPAKSIRDAETAFLMAAAGRHHSMLALCLKWLQSLQSNGSIRKIVTQALHGVFCDQREFDLQHYTEILDWNSIADSMWSALEDGDETYNHKICTSLHALWISISYADPMVPLMKMKYTLAEAALHGYLHIVKIMVQNGADVNSALQAAACTGNSDIVNYLVEKGADVNGEGGGSFGHALQAAVYSGRLDIVQYLVERGADVNAEGGEYGFALQAAAIGVENLNIVKYLVGMGADVDAMGGIYGSALHAAAYEGNMDIVRYLVENGADVNAKGGEYGSALQVAAVRGNLDIIKYLVEKEVDINAQGGNFGSALQAAAVRGNLDIFKYLVERKANVNAMGGMYGSALQAAARWGHLEIVKYLVEQGADVNAKGGNFWSALQAAAVRGNLDIIKYLVERGANVNAREGVYGPALHVAAHWGHLGVVQYLVKKGADINAKGGKYGSALKAAQARDRIEVVRYLHFKGATR
ncbi:hypothetical protein D9758_006138 [Tetrapyrgos nigripes]|uniref:DUF6535 domain-containing protein n=1 Tax=Tetrapyrgos nigripes TaxID=182062 RepID=A0A8H5GAS6_9AGAR|nr:hypothetical protein D9758_006138 [Tetrapyrgos nigripes]